MHRCSLLVEARALLSAAAHHNPFPGPSGVGAQEGEGAEGREQRGSGV